MFEAVELGRKVSKSDYEEAVPKLRAELLTAQFAMRETSSPVIVVISGVEAAGKAELVNQLSQWFDIRGIRFHTFGQYTDEEIMRPPSWRYWISLPARGQMGFYLGSWYARPIRERAFEGGPDARFDQQLTQIRQYERMLAADGAIVLKFWLHITADEQRRRLERLEADDATSWRVTKNDWRQHEAYDDVVIAAEHAIRQTDVAEAPWFLVEARNRRYRNLTVAQTILEAMQARLRKGGQHNGGAVLPPITATLPGDTASTTILDRVDLTHSLDGKGYRDALDAQQGRLGRLGRAAYEAGVSTVVLFEGWDAAGKGGAIRRLTSALDARSLQVISVAAPTDEELAHHYLWRFWRHVPRAGAITIYDRSWYGRVLVERVEGFAREDEWSRAYQEINFFEERLLDHGIVLVKFFLHIDRDEQLRRFEERQQIPYKQHKITDEDWRNREKWPQYESAINEMVARTSTSRAPWNLIGGNDKKWARVEIVRRTADALEARLDALGGAKRDKRKKKKKR